MACDQTIVPVQEGQSGVLTFTIKDQAGVAVAKSMIESLTLDLYRKDTWAVINGRNHQPVLDANGVTMHATSGLVTWTIEPDDIPFLGSDSIDQEVHIAHFRAVWDGGTKAYSHEIKMVVCNLHRFAVA